MKGKRRIWIFTLAQLDTGVPHYRLVAPFDYFPRDEFEIIYALSVKAIMKMLFIPDVIVFQRILYPFKEINKILKFARFRGIPTILELDDLITDVPLEHPSHPMYTTVKPSIEQLLKSVDFVTVTNDRLKEHIKSYNSNVYVLMNLVDERVWGFINGKKKAADDKILIGYSGSLPHGHDFKVVIPAIRYILQKYSGRVYFKFLGYIPDGFKGMPGVYHIDIIDSYIQYAKVLRNSNFDFALAPLADNAFNQCKSNSKFLEYSICGYPGIYSRISTYTDSIIHTETGLLVNNTAEDWIQAMELLVNNPELRNHLSQNAYNYVKANYLLKEKAGEWSKFYADIVSSRNKISTVDFSLIPLVSYAPYIIYVQLRKIYRVFLGIFKRIYAIIFRW